MTGNDIKQIDALIKKNLKSVATKKDLTSVEARLRKDMATKKDLAATETRLRQDMATKKDLSALRQEVKDDLEEAVAQISSAIEKTITPLVRRVEKIEEHLELTP